MIDIHTARILASDRARDFETRAARHRWIRDARRRRDDVSGRSQTTARNVIPASQPCLAC